MASSGSDNWNRNWKGGNRESVVKKACPYFTKNDNGTFTRVGNLNPQTPITYIDSETTDHLKSAVMLQNDQNVYYVNIDNLVKPRTIETSSPPLNPSSFGIENYLYGSSSAYYNKIKNAINSRDDVNGELFDYLYELLEYCKRGTTDFSGIQLTGFPWGQLQNYYSEVIGPLSCIHRGILNGIIPATGLAGAKIYFPPDSEALYDYKLIVGSAEYLISAKSARGVSNQVKPQFVVEVVDNILPVNLSTSSAYSLLKVLGKYSAKEGPFYGWQILQTTQEITPGAINDILTNYAPRNKRSQDKIVDVESWKPFLKKYFSGRKATGISYGEVRYKCENLIQAKSKTGKLNSDLKKIFSIYLNESRVIYVKLNINKSNGVPTFTASGGGGSNLIRRLYLRSSNYANRTADRIGFQVS